MNKMVETIEAGSPEGLSYFKKHYEAHGCKVDLCGFCGKLKGISYPEKPVDMPSISSGMYCNSSICQRKEKNKIFRQRNIDFVSAVHKSTKRDYLARVNEYPKAVAAEKAKEWGYDYWDGDRRICYGGYHYDGRWTKVAAAMVDHYGLKPGDRVLDVGCGKGFLLYDFMRVLPGIDVTGIDISDYAIENAKDDVKPFLRVCHAEDMSSFFDDDSFDLVVSINTLHNIYCYGLINALKEIERVGRKDKYVCVESYSNEKEKVNLLYWQVTCEMFCTPQEWEWWFDLCGYTGDYSFIYFKEE